MNTYRRAGTIGVLIAIMAVAVMGVCMAGASDADVGDYQIESAGPMKAAPTATVFDDAGLGYAVQSDSLMLVSVPTDATSVTVPVAVDDNGTVRNVAAV